MSGLTDGTIWTVVVAAGSGTRFGAPKQFLDLAGQRVVDRSVAAAAAASDGVVLVVPINHDADGEPTDTHADTQIRVVTGAGSRSGSVRRGLAAVPPDASVILIHDGARPLATPVVFERVIAAVRAGADAVAPCIPVADSLRRRQGGVVDRNDVAAVQTPQGFSAAAIRAAHAEEAEATDDVTLVETAGGTVAIVDGDRRNLKLTTPLDLEIAALFLERDGGA